jgi:thiol-disulfide isomerase/thioredoxin
MHSLVLLMTVWLAFLNVIPARGQTTSPALIPEQQRTAAPDFRLADTKGAPLSLSHFRGRVVLLDFWATWCTGCKVEIPWYIEFQKKYASQGLTSIGAAMDDEGWKVVTPYLDAHPIPYPIVIGNPDLVQPYKIANLPVTLLVDRRGRIADAHAGVVEKNAWEQEIRQLLRER